MASDKKRRMTEKDYIRRAKAAKRRRQRQLRRRIAIGVAVIAVIIVVIICSVKLKKRKAERVNESKSQSEQTADINITPTPVPQPSEGVSEEPASEVLSAQGNTEENTGENTGENTQTSDNAGGGLYNHSDYVVDRSTFAVDPAVPCGNNHMTEEKVVYLTLDDGPCATTPQILDILDRYGIKCTFFVTAQNPEYLYLIKECYDRGHTIGLHTYSHDYADIYSSPEAYFADLDRIAQIVAEQIGYVPCFIRFPGGSCNYVSHDYCEGIMTQLSTMVQERGYQYFDWNCSSGDGGSCTDPVQLAAAATSCDYWENIVLLSHDAPGKESTIEALPTIIEHYLSEGYEFRPITRDAYTSHQEIFN